MKKLIILLMLCASLMNTACRTEGSTDYANEYDKQMIRGSLTIVLFLILLYIFIGIWECLGDAAQVIIVLIGLAAIWIIWGWLPLVIIIAILAICGLLGYCWDKWIDKK
jgi:hypothetical protein